MKKERQKQDNKNKSEKVGKSYMQSRRDFGKNDA
jgi:hypothetical protein